ncbi:Nucleoside-diphosphate-sugar epimerase [bacterium A37T11]|nr:Nucleoside-diphosphate-sugar epimerase [bacterium A37T11]
MNNYLGKKLALHLAGQDHEVACLVRHKAFSNAEFEKYDNLSILQADLLRETYGSNMPLRTDVAFYVNEISSERGGIYRDMELISLQNYIKKLRRISCEHLIYLTRLRSPIAEDALQMLHKSYIPFTVVRTSNIIGKESTLMNIMGKLTSNKVILASSLIAKSRTQPIALKDVFSYLKFMIMNAQVFDRKFDLGGPDSLSYEEMVQKYLEICQIKHRHIIQLPIKNGCLPDLLLSFSTGLSRPSARAFLKTASYDLLCEEDGLQEIFPYQATRFVEAVKLAIS